MKPSVGLCLIVVVLTLGCTPKTAVSWTVGKTVVFCLVASPQGIFGCLLNMEAGSSESKSSKIELVCVL